MDSLVAFHRRDFVAVLCPGCHPPGKGVSSLGIFKSGPHIDFVDIGMAGDHRIRPMLQRNPNRLGKLRRAVYQTLGYLSPDQYEAENGPALAA